MDNLYDLVFETLKRNTRGNSIDLKGINWVQFLNSLSNHDLVRLLSDALELKQKEFENQGGKK